jgi:hypothetical protein
VSALRQLIDILLLKVCEGLTHTSENLYANLLGVLRRGIVRRGAGESDIGVTGTLSGTDVLCEFKLKEAAMLRWLRYLLLLAAIGWLAFLLFLLGKGLWWLFWSLCFWC